MKRGDVCTHPGLGTVQVMSEPYDHAPVAFYVGGHVADRTERYRAMARGENRRTVVDVVTLGPGRGGSVRGVPVSDLVPAKGDGEKS